jgi:hypothetical protein
MNTLTYEERMAELSDFIAKHAQGPAQRTEEWYKLRQESFGGSEIASLLGSPKGYGGALSVFKSKSGQSSFRGNTATRWGTLFENTTRTFMEQLTSSEIYEVSGIKAPEIDHLHYSPDGLAVIYMKSEDGTMRAYTVLFEFKAPHSTIPNSAIPEQYKPQIWTGMALIPIVENCIFVNNCYRRCSLTQLNNTAVYDTDYHGKDKTKKGAEVLSETECLAYGVIGIYQTVQCYEAACKKYLESRDVDAEADEELADPYAHYNRTHDMEILIFSSSKPVDFGKSSRYQLDRMFELLDSKLLNACHSSISYNTALASKLSTVDKFMPAELKSYSGAEQAAECAGRVSQQGDMLVGYLPWKLIRSNIIIEQPRADWYNMLTELIPKRYAELAEHRVGQATGDEPAEPVEPEVVADIGDSMDAFITTHD